MIFFRRLALHRFVKTHTPSSQVAPAPKDLVSAYERILPQSLLELWCRKGLGFYGELQLTLIDPRLWQSVLDRWIIVPPTDTVRRIPIALTPFGRLLYYRKLTETDEDVNYIDPVSKKTGDLAWSLNDFFNDVLCDHDFIEAIFSPALVKTAREECGPLDPGEIYEIDQMLFSMQMLKIAKVDAFDMHRRLCDAVDPAAPKADKPMTVADALPVEHRCMFEGIVKGPGLVGLYLSSYIDWHRLLALQPDGQYHLLFWQIERIEVRSYSGSYKVSLSSDGDENIELDIVLRVGYSLGSDANDDRLVAIHSDGTTLLLRGDALEDIATAISGRDVMGCSEYYFRRVTLSDAFVQEPHDGRVAPPFVDLPKTLQALIHVEPLLTTITHVDDPNLDEEDEGEGIVMCTLDLGENDGLRKNMPIYSPRDAGRQLKGWVWGMAPHACKAGIEYRRGEDGSIEHGPMVGDVLITRAPN